jgi:hypothetical protein
LSTRIPAKEEISVCPPSERSSRARLLFILFAVALFVQFVAVRRTLGAYDESLSLYGADRVLHGEIPYRDFWTMYGPSQFYLLALFFKLFGVSALVGRFYDALIRAGIACACFALVSRLASRRYAALAFAAVLLWLTCIDDAAYNFPVFPALLLSLISCLCFSRYLDDPSRLGQLFAAGVLTGVTLSFRHDSAFYVCVAQIATLFWSGFSNQATGSSASESLSALRRPALCYVSGILIVAIPLLLLLLWKVPVHDLFYDLFYVPGKIYPKVRRLPFENLAALRPLRHPFGQEGRSVLEGSIVFFPVPICMAALALLLTRRRSRLHLFDRSWQRDTFALLTLLGSLLFIKGVVRVSPIHMLQSVIVGAVLLAVLFSRISRLNRTYSIVVAGCALYFITCTSPLIPGFARFTRANIGALLHPGAPNSLYTACHPPIGLERARCMTIDPVAIAAIRDVQQHTSSQDRIFVGAGRHDKLFLNDVRFYFVAGRPSVTKWHELHPGVQTTLPIQNEIIESMRAYSPKLIVLNSTWDDILEPNDSRYSSGVTILDGYIREHYAPRSTFGSVTILTPR